MRLNLNKLFVDDYFDNYYAYKEVDCAYINKATGIDKRERKDNKRKYKKSLLEWCHFNIRVAKFVGCNVSELYYSYAKENNKYTESLVRLIRDYVDITNRNGDIVDRNGFFPKYGSAYYLDDNDIICRNLNYAPTKSARKNKDKVKTDYDYLIEHYHEIEDDMLEKRIAYLSFHKRSNGELNRILKPYKDKLEHIESRYTAIYNSINCRIVRDKSYNHIKTKRVNLNVSKPIVKQKSSALINKIIKHKNPFSTPRCSVFSGLY